MGASTVVELTFGEALTMLAQNLNNARNSLKQINEELEYIKDQKTTTEVNVARVYNHSIMENREAQLKKDNKEEWNYCNQNDSKWFMLELSFWEFYFLKWI